MASNRLEVLSDELRRSQEQLLRVVQAPQAIHKAYCKHCCIISSIRQFGWSSQPGLFLPTKAAATTIIHKQTPEVLEERLKEFGQDGLEVNPAIRPNVSNAQRQHSASFLVKPEKVNCTLTSLSVLCSIPFYSVLRHSEAQLDVYHW